MTRDLFSIEPLHVGVCHLGERHVLGDEYSDEDRIEFAMYSFFLSGCDGGRILVDLGPKTLHYANEMFRTWGFFRGQAREIENPDDIRQPHGNIFAHLSRLGVNPEAIDRIIFTHLHADHHGIDDARDGGAVEDFPRAVFHISGTGWRYNLDQRRDGQWSGYLDHGFGNAMLRIEQEGRLVAADNADVVPGVRTHYLGGHSLCSQAVRVETEAGPVVITSDDLYRYDLLESGHLARIRTSLEQLLAATCSLVDAVLDEGAILLPVHDPLIWELRNRSADRWLEEARRYSVRAAEGFRNAQAAGKIPIAETQ